MASELTCSVCGGVVIEAHKCILCKKIVQLFCGNNNEDEEKFGQIVSCFICLKKEGKRRIWNVFRNEVDLFHFLKSAYVYVKVETQGHSHWGGGRGVREVIAAPSSHFNFRTKQSPKVTISNIRDIAFYRCSEIIQTRNSHFLPYMLQFLDNLWWLFIFSNYIGEADHFTLDLLKRSDT